MAWVKSTATAAVGSLGLLALADPAQAAQAVAAAVLVPIQAVAMLPPLDMQSPEVLDSIREMVSDVVQGELVGLNAAAGSSSASLMSGARSAWDAYCDTLSRHPLPTKMATGLVGTLIGDTIAQAIEYLKARGLSSGSGGGPVRFRFDVERCVRFVAFSSIIGAPLSHYWFGALDKFVLPGAPPGDPLAVFLKVLLDQGLQTPLGLAAMFGALQALQDPREVGATLRAKLPPALRANYALWPAVQLVNFALVPLDLRPLFCTVIGIGWAAYISAVAAAAGQEQQQQREGLLARSHSLGSEDAAELGLPLTSQFTAAFAEAEASMGEDGASSRYAR